MQEFFRKPEKEPIQKRLKRYWQERTTHPIYLRQLIQKDVVLFIGIMLITMLFTSITFDVFSIGMTILVLIIWCKIMVEDILTVCERRYVIYEGICEAIQLRGYRKQYKDIYVTIGNETYILTASSAKLQYRKGTKILIYTKPKTRMRDTDRGIQIESPLLVKPKHPKDTYNYPTEQE